MSQRVLEIGPDELERLPSGVRVVDVREPGEYAGGHIPEAENVPLGSLERELEALSGPVVFVCASGNRSGKAAGLLSGYRDAAGRTGNGPEIANLVGGTKGWISSGRRVVSGNGSTTPSR